MVAQAGIDLLVKIDISGSGLFETVAGMRASKLALNAQTINVTNLQSAGRWRELLAGGGVKTASLTGSGVFVDAQSDARMRDLFFQGELVATRFCIPDFGNIEGKFQIAALEYSGSYDGEVQYEFNFVSGGELRFVEVEESVE